MLSGGFFDVSNSRTATEHGGISSRERSHLMDLLSLLLGNCSFLQCHRIGNDDGDRVAGCLSIVSNYRAIWQLFPICSSIGGDGCYQQAAILLVCPNLSYAQ